MQNTNYAAVVNAINCYEDNVLHEAKAFALAMCAQNENYCTDSLFDEINDSVDELGLQTHWQHAELREAIDLYNDEFIRDALFITVIAMLKRSAAYEELLT